MRLRLFFFGLIVNMTTRYDCIGGAAKVRELVTRFYRNKDELPEAYGIRQMHPTTWKARKSSCSSICVAVWADLRSIGDSDRDQ